MKKDTDWKEIHGMNIKSDRDAKNGEKICVFVINSETDEILERNLFIPNNMEANHYIWPQKLSEKINQSSLYIKAGEKNKNGDIVPLDSQYRNKLWKSVNSTLTVFPTNCSLDCWQDGGEIFSTSSLIPGIKIIVSINSKKNNLLYERLIFISNNESGSQYSWPYHLSTYINENSLFLRAGEKNDEESLIKPIWSSYRNKVWLPNGSNYIYEMDFKINDDIRDDAKKVYHNALTQLTINKPPSKNEIDKWIKEFELGKFNDIDYPSSEAKSNIEPLYEHLNRIKNIANYIHHNNITINDIYYTCAIKALYFYTSQNYKTSNWWDIQIGLAKIVAESLIILVEHFTSSTLNNCIDYLKKTTNITMGQTGANQADFAYIQLLWAISGWKNTEQSSFINEAYGASDTISTLCLPVPRHGDEDGEGISIDNSFSQHNPQSGKYSQLYAGSYGIVLLGNIFKIQSILDGVFSLKEEAIRSLENFFINGMGWFSYATLYDFHVCGRAISRGMNSSEALAGWCKQLLNCNPKQPEILQEIISRIENNEEKRTYYQGCRTYWVNDYLVQFTDSYCLWTKVISTRTVGSETGNGENLKGYYMGCGSYLIRKVGDEYNNIQPIWDWLRIPGTTVEQVPNFSYPSIDWGYNDWGSSDFSGVISNQEIGITSMILSRKNIKSAKKSIIALSNKTIFMGSSIDISETNNAVYTSINQCIHSGNVTIFYNDGTHQILESNKNITSNEIIKITHNGLSYNFPFAQKITVQIITQTGSWYDINRNGSSDKISNDIFSLWIEHEKGNIGTYYYEITDIDNASLPSQITSVNNDSYHIITDLEKKSVAAIIFANNAFEITLDNIKIKALSPITFIAKIKPDGILEITIADFTQKMTSVDLLFTWEKITSLITFPLPILDNAGKSITYLIPPIKEEDK